MALAARPQLRNKGFPCIISKIDTLAPSRATRAVARARVEALGDGDANLSSAGNLPVDTVIMVTVLTQ